jgi:hypothetical protein
VSALKALAWTVVVAVVVTPLAICQYRRLA